MPHSLSFESGLIEVWPTVSQWPLQTDRACIALSNCCNPLVLGVLKDNVFQLRDAVIGP